ncbi:MAG TPA: hypothetical protein VGJ05_04955 [Fimbriiglobus sp.]|jgi:hypothetical protein
MPISVTCPHCSATLKAPDDRAGKRSKCTNCGQKLTVPGPPPPPEAQEFAFLSEDTTRPETPDAASQKYRPTKSGTGGIKVAIGFVLAGGAILAGIAGYGLWVRFGPKPQPAKTTPTLTEPVSPEPPKNPAPADGEKPIPVPLADAKQGHHGTKARGPVLPPAPAGTTLVEKADASFVLPVPVEKIHTVLIGSAGSMGVVLHRAFAGLNGMGATDAVDRFAIPSGVPAGRIEIPALAPGRMAALAPDGSKLAVEGPPGSLAIWDLNRDDLKSPASVFVPFPPADGKPLALAACYYLTDDRVVAVGPRGELAVYDAGRKATVVETGPVGEKPLGSPLSQGQSIAMTVDGRTLVFVTGERVFEVAVQSGKVVSSAVELPKTAAVRAVAVDPAGARVLVAFSDDIGNRIAVYPLGADKPKTALYFPAALGDFESVNWIKDNCVLVAGTKDPGFLAFDAEVGRWVAYVRAPATPGLRVRGTDRAYALVPAEKGNAKLVGVAWPFNDYFTERDFAANTKSIVAYVLTAEGLRK